MKIFTEYEKYIGAVRCGEGIVGGGSEGGERKSEGKKEWSTQ